MKQNSSEKVEGTAIYMAGVTVLLVCVVVGAFSAIVNAVDGNPLALWIVLPGVGLALLLVGFFNQVLHYLKRNNMQLLDMESDLEVIAHQPHTPSRPAPTYQSPGDDQPQRTPRTH